MKQRDDHWQRNHIKKKKKIINLITRSNHIWVGSWNTVGSHSFFDGEVIGASLVAYFKAWERERERERHVRLEKRESFWNFWIGVSLKKREEKLKEQREMRVTRITDVSKWVVQLLSIRWINCMARIRVFAHRLIP